MIDYDKDDILLIARHLSQQGFYYSDQWEQAANEIERLREALRLYQCQCEDGQCAVAFDDDERGELCGMPARAALGEGK